MRILTHRPLLTDSWWTSFRNPSATVTTFQWQKKVKNKLLKDFYIKCITFWKREKKSFNYLWKRPWHACHFSSVRHRRPCRPFRLFLPIQMEKIVRIPCDNTCEIVITLYTSCWSITLSKQEKTAFIHSTASRTLCAIISSIFVISTNKTVTLSNAYAGINQ